jgi:hypothetical protein
MQARPRSPSSSASRILRGLLAGGAAALVAFHGGLLWQRLADGSLLEPAVAARWGATALLLTWIAIARRAGTSLFRGERARTFWVLVLLLHAVPAMAGGDASSALESRGLLLVLPAALAGGLVAGLPLLGRPGHAARPRGVSVRLAEPPCPAPRPVLARRLAARAPPA